MVGHIFSLFFIECPTGVNTSAPISTFTVFKRGKQTLTAVGVAKRTVDKDL